MKSKLTIYNLLMLLFSFSFIPVSNGQNYSLYIKNNGLSCNEYSYVDIGDLSISGNKLTVEAVVQTISNGACQSSLHHDVVSKHYDNRDVNYLLRPGYATINTENGYFETKPFTVTNNECHHIAMTYDGMYLRFYFDNLIDSVRATGNLITNPFNTLIGYAAGFNPNWYTQYFGFIDEVRIWNVARTKQQIQDNAFKTIADPTNQAGLLAYYDFQSGYQNKAKNEPYNGVQRGNCLLAPDSVPCVNNDSPASYGNIVMYPNPLNNTGTVQFNIDLTNTKITIYDVYGRKLNIVKEISGDVLKLERHYLSNGLYFVILSQESNTISISKLVVFD